MKKFFIMFLLVTSCSKKYKYIEVMTVNTNENKEMIRELEAKNDSMAYFEGYLNYYISQKMYEQTKEKYGENPGFEIYTEPLSFRVLNSKGDNIMRSGDYDKKEELLQMIRESVDKIPDFK